MVWTGDFACDDLAMSQADQDDQGQAEQLVREAGGVTPLSGLAMAMLPDRTLRVVAHFEDSRAGEEEPPLPREAGRRRRPGARRLVRRRLQADRLAGRAAATSSSTSNPGETTGYVLSALYDGPVLFATC